jgi:hypothetical protein
LGSLSIKNGTGNADNVTNLLEGVNTAGSITSFIRADGLISGSGVQATTISATTIQTPSVTLNNNGLTATTISATTYVNLPTDIRVTGATYSNNTFTYTNNTGGTFNVNFNTLTGLTVNGNLTVTGNSTFNNVSATTISATTYQNLPLGSIETSGSTLYSTNPSTSDFNTDNNILLGQDAGFQASGASNSNFFGLQSGYQASDANNSNFLGTSAGNGATSAFESNFLGQLAGLNATSANNSNFLGRDAGNNATNASNSNFMGVNAGFEATNASFSNFLGQQAGYQATNAQYSNFLGNSAGFGATDANNSNFIGLSTGKGANNANDSNFLGTQAGQNATNANNSNFLGQKAGQSATDANNSNFLGNGAGFQATNASDSNFFGYQSGFQATGATNSNIFGYQAGYAVSTIQSIGSNNIIIGTNISLPSGATNSINLGGVLFGKNTYSDTNTDPSITAQTQGRIGINVVNPTEALHVSGNTLIQGTLTATTISATTYQNLPLDIRVTGATYSNNTFTHTNNTGGTFNVLFNTVTGLTINGNLNVTGDYVVSGNTIISGTTVYSGDVTYNSNATVNGILTGAYASPYIQIGSSYTATSVNSTIEVTGGTFTLTLPNANQKIGKQLYIKNDGTGIVTISGSTAGQTIDGFSQRKLARYEELLIQSDGSSNWIILNKKAHTILFGHEWTTGAAPLDSTIYYIGNFLTQQASTTQSPSRQVIAMSSGWATDVSLMVSTAAPLGTSEDSTLTLRNVTTATNSTITTTLEHNVAAQLLNFTLSSPLQITKGDVLEIQWLTPNWGTNPAAVRHVAQVLLN